MSDSDIAASKKRVADNRDREPESLQPFSIDALYGWDAERVRKRLAQRAPKPD